MKKVLISLLLGVSMVTMVGCGNANNANKGVITEEEIYMLEIGETMEVNGIYDDDYGTINVMIHYLEDDTYEEDSLWIENCDEKDLEDGYFYNVELKKTKTDYKIIKAKKIKCTGEARGKAKDIFSDLDGVYDKLKELSVKVTSSKDEYFDLKEELDSLDVSDCGIKELQPYFDRVKEMLEGAIKDNLDDYSNHKEKDFFDYFTELVDEMSFIEECLY